MSVAARRMAKSSIARKLMTYRAAWEAGRHRHQWGMQGFRVATITSSESRIAHMLAAQRKITGNSAHALFLYTTATRLHAEGPLAPIWQSSEATGICLMERT